MGFACFVSLFVSLHFAVSVLVHAKMWTATFVLIKRKSYKLISKLKKNLLTNRQDHVGLIFFWPHQCSLTWGVLAVHMPEIKEKDLIYSLWIIKIIMHIQTNRVLYNLWYLSYCILRYTVSYYDIILFVMTFIY